MGNPTPRILVWLRHPSQACLTFGREHAHRLVEALPGAAVRVAEDEGEFLQLLPESEVAAVWTFRQEWFARADRLRWLVTPAAGRDYFHVTPPDGVRLLYGAFHGEFMAETVLGMMLGMCRGILRARELQETDPWPDRALDQTMRLLRGAHVGILGFGSIGAWVGRLAKPFGARITGIRRTVGEAPDYFDATDQVVPVSELDDVLPALDHLVLALPRSPETDNILDADRLARLAPHCVLYNVGRGNVIDEDALARALREGRLAGAALDVFREEPLPADSPLRACPNALLMPHVSALAPEYMDRFADELARRIERQWP